MDRRQFIQIFGGGMVATATMAEAGFLSDFMGWIKRMPAWSIPRNSSIAIVSYENYVSVSDLALDTAIYYDEVAIYYDEVAIYYDEVSIANLKSMTLYKEFSSRRAIPPHSGEKIRLFL